MYRITLIRDACFALFNEGLVKQPFNRGPAPTKPEFTHLTCICCYLSSSKRPRPVSEAGNRRWKAGVFYQRAAGGAERSDETDPSSASPTGCNGGPGNEASAAAQSFLLFCAVIKLRLCCFLTRSTEDPKEYFRLTLRPVSTPNGR